METKPTGEEAGVPEERGEALQGKWEEVHDSQVLNVTVYTTTGEEIGKIQQVLKDTKSGETEYVVVVSKEAKL